MSDSFYEPSFTLHSDLMPRMLERLSVRCNASHYYDNFHTVHSTQGLRHTLCNSFTSNVDAIWVQPRLITIVRGGCRVTIFKIMPMVNTLLKSDVTRRDHVVRCHWSHECWFTHRQFHSKFHSRSLHSLRITSWNLQHWCTCAAVTRTTMKSWQRQRVTLGLYTFAYEFKCDFRSLSIKQYFVNNTFLTYANMFWCIDHRSHQYCIM